MNAHPPPRVVIDQPTLHARVRALGEEISHDYAGREIALVGVLKGAVVFMVDLARHIRVPVTMDFLAVSSYGASTRSSGVVRILKDVERTLADAHVLVIEDIVDTGLTLAYLLEHLRSQRPASLDVCVLLDKAEARVTPVPVRYTGFVIPNQFVVGYGLDYAEQYRNLPEIVAFPADIRPGAALV